MPQVQAKKGNIQEARCWTEGRVQAFRDLSVFICVHCHNTFKVNEGIVTPVSAVCNLCNGDTSARGRAKSV